MKNNIVHRLLRKIYRYFVPYPPIKDAKQEVLEFLLSCGVETQYGYVTLFGRPIIKKVANSRIVIGKGVTLVSENDVDGRVFNPAGISHPVMLSTLLPGAEIIINDNVGISGSSIVAAKKIVIGENTMLGNNSNVYDTDFHPIDYDARNNQVTVEEAPSKEINIGKNCWICSNSTILKGCDIGECSVVGAMSLVNRSIPQNVLVGGVPARVIRSL